MNIASLRCDYMGKSLNEADVTPDPFQQFQRWFDEAVRADVFGNAGYPQMLLRIGWAPVNAEPLPTTPRRPLTEVAEWVGAPDPIRSALA